MVMPSSGPLNMGGTTSPVSVAAELGLGLTSTISMNDSNVRTLAQVGGSGTQWSMSSLYGKANTVTLTYLVVAGGGSGGSYQPAIIDGHYQGGGGGAGGLRNGTWTTAKGVTITITVGAGGANAAFQGNDGNNSQISASGQTTVTALRGGGGGEYGAAGNNPSPGVVGSGGGAGRDNGQQGLGTSGQGNNGGKGGGGGGGAGEVGYNGDVVPPSPYTLRGQGGAGLGFNFLGSTVYYAGGGGGAPLGGLCSIPGGLGGGGNGANVYDCGDAPTSGTANRGGGGGAAGNYVDGQSGGSGVVIISAPVSAASATGSYTSQVGVGGNIVYTFTGSGTLTY